MNVTAGRGRGRRPVVRWALRLARREWRQQVAVVVLLTVAVAAAITGAAAAINAVPDPAGEFGAGHERIVIDASAGDDGDSADPAADVAAIDAARRRFGTIDVVAHGHLDRPTSLTPFDVRDQDPYGAYSAPMLAVRDGRYPTGDGEVALTAGVAKELGVDIGGSLPVGGRDRTVVGIVENPAAISQEFALVAPGTLAAADSFTLLIDPDARAPSGAPTEADRAASGRMRREGVGTGEEQAVALAVLTASGAALALVGLIAATGFVVVAQRRQRQLGLLAAIGADDRHVRLVMVANGAIVGVVSALAGSALGLVGWVLARPAVERAGDHRVGLVALPWLLLGAIVVLAVTVATVAAWWPARVASHRSTMGALSGRPVRPRPVGRTLVASAVGVAAGVTGIVTAHVRTDHVHPYRLLAGLLALIAGVVLVAPAAVRLLGAMARRMPLAPRIALRDLARHQARAGAALAAITLGLGIATTIVGIAGANEPDPGAGNLSDRQLLLQIGDPATDPDPTLDAAGRAALDSAAADVVAALGADARSVALDVVYGAASPDLRSAAPSLMVGVKGTDDHSIKVAGQLYAATPEVLAFFGLDPASIDPGVELLQATDGAYLILDIGKGPPDLGTSATAGQRVDLSAYDSAPGFLVPAAAIERHGWRTARSGWFVESATPLTSAQISAVRAAAERAGLVVEVRTSTDGIAALRTGATSVGAAVALAIVLMSVGLLRSEAAAEMRTLAATGASPGTRRMIGASTAVALAVLGVVLGVGGGYAALVSAYHARLGDLRPLPLADLAVLVAGVPVAAAIAGWIGAGREPRSFGPHPAE